jgi:Txe/YoeB family toxin of Txe-Axe toxin-antitoxin module
MKSHATKSFWKLFAALPEDVQKRAYKAYRRFTRDPFGPGLNFELVNPRKGLWSARISDQYRVLGYRDGGQVVWFWIGTHREYEKLIG